MLYPSCSKAKENAEELKFVCDCLLFLDTLHHANGKETKKDLERNETKLLSTNDMFSFHLMLNYTMIQLQFVFKPHDLFDLKRK